MTRLAYLSMDSLADFECYDYLTIEPLRSLGYEVSEVSWRADIRWDDFDAVIIRSPWDYQDAPEQFMSVLRAIEQSSARLVNPLSVVEWNINKAYLRDLQNAGADIVPTLWSMDLQMAELEHAVSHFGSDELIVKPAVSANADDTFRIPSAQVAEFFASHGPLFCNRECLIQPFLSSVLEEGEFSLFYFNGELSHCILKTPAQGDFRVQEEHGGRLRLIESPEAQLLQAGARVVDSLPQKLLYGRLDFVRHGDAFLLMEAELIEPSLYFNMDPTSPERFARAVQAFGL